MKLTAKRRTPKTYSRLRQGIVLGVVCLGMSVLGVRAFQVQILDSSRLQAEGAARQLRNIAVKPERGRIVDRNGDVLAVSTPLDLSLIHI